MQSDALIPVSWRSKPRSFVALMSLYEANYLRLHALCGDPARLVGECWSRVPGDCDLVLSVTEQAPYTTGLVLSYLLPAATSSSPVAGVPPLLERFPEVNIRVYSDARLVEAQFWSDGAAPVAGAPRRREERELDQRWTRNVMLNKWLEYCLGRGHRFR